MIEKYNLLLKVCGVTNLEDANILSLYPVDYLGFVFYEKSPRNINLEVAKTIYNYNLQNIKKEKIKFIAVVVNPEFSFLKKISSFVDGFQLHGNESPEFCDLVKQEFPNHLLWKAICIESLEDINKSKIYPMISTFLFDTFSPNLYGGTGENINQDILPYLSKNLLLNQKFFLAGGINKDNALYLSNLSKAHGIDISSSLEVYKGKKSKENIEEFFSNIL